MNKRCPFCGGKVNPIGWSGVDPYGNHLRGPECEVCEATARTMKDWNRRVRIAWWARFCRWVRGMWSRIVTTLRNLKPWRRFDGEPPAGSFTSPAKPKPPSGVPAAAERETC